MSRYGEAPRGEQLLAQLDLRPKGHFEFELQPTLWKTAGISPFYAGRNWTSVPFTESVPGTVPQESGIYMFVAAPHCGGLIDHSYIFYVGQAVDLKRRYREYLLEKKGLGAGPRPLVMRFLNFFSDFMFFHFTLIPPPDLDHAEALLKDNLTPFGNSQTSVIGRL